jgi:hypothetical protein
MSKRVRKYTYRKDSKEGQERLVHRLPSNAIEQNEWLDRRRRGEVE